MNNKTKKKPFTLSALKVGDRVRYTAKDKSLKIKKGEYATIDEEVYGGFGLYTDSGKNDFVENDDTVVRADEYYQYLEDIEDGY